MSEKQKPRKSHPGQNSEPNWRTRQHCNTSKLKYSRDAVLEKFQPSESFPIPVPDDILVVFLKDSSLPLNNPEKFLHGLGESVNSRKFFSREKTNEKGHAEIKKKEENEKKVEVNVPEVVKEISEIWGLNEVEEEKLDKKAAEGSKSEKVLINKEEIGLMNNKVEEISKKESENGVKVGDKVKVHEKIEEGKKNVGNLDKAGKEILEGKEQAKVKSGDLNVDQSLKQTVPAEKSNNSKSGKEQQKKQSKEPVKVETEPLIKPSVQSKSPFGTGKKPSEPVKNLEQEKKQIEPSKKSQNPAKAPIDSVKNQESKPKEAQKHQPENSNPSKKPLNTVQPKVNPSEQSNPKSISLPSNTEATPPSSSISIPIPSLEKSQLASCSSTPFAKILLFTGKAGEDPSKLYFSADLKVFERLWFYKDLQGSTQGPFSCLEMFNWVAKGCFPDSLQIAFCNSEFLPMNYNNPPQKTESPPGHLSKKNPWSNSAKLFSRDNNKK